MTKELPGLKRQNEGNERAIKDLESRNRSNEQYKKQKQDFLKA